MFFMDKMKEKIDFLYIVESTLNFSAVPVAMSKKNAEEGFEDSNCSLGFLSMLANKCQKSICAKDKITPCLFFPSTYI